jgi:polysaccharide biosynthesis transport protein
MATEPQDNGKNALSVEIDLIGLVRRRWPLVFVGVFLGICGAFAYQYTATPIYEADIEILVGRRTSELTNSGTATSAYASGDLIQEDQLATHMQLFISRRILGDAISKHGLDKFNSFVEAKKKGRPAIDHILDNMEIRRGGQGTAQEAMVLSASFSDANPENASQVLAAIYESYKDYVERHAQNTSEDAIELIKAAQETHEVELREADRVYREFIANVPVLLDGEKVKDIHKERLASMESELNSVRTSLAQAQSRLEVIQTYLGEAKDGVVSDMDHLALLSQREVERLKLFLDVTRGEIQSEAFQAEQPIRQEVAKAQYNRLLDLLQKERTLAEDYGAGHPLVEATKQEIDVIRSFISENAPVASADTSKKMDPQSMLQTFVQLLKNDIVDLTKRREMLLVDSETELKKAKEIENSFLMGASLKSNLNRAQARYDEVALRLQEINLSGSYAGFSTDILADPEVESTPAWPRLPIIGILGTVLGGLFGLSLAVLAEITDTTFHDASDVEKSVGAAVCAHVPQFDLAALRKKVSADSHVAAVVAAFHAPRSSEAEIYRVARTSLLFRKGEGNAQILMVTSPHPGDGKSTTISNLAVSFAQTGKKVLLIDADMRRPTINSIFGIDSSPGLSDAILAVNELHLSFHDSEVPNLSIMPHGVRTSEPAELLQSPKFQTVLDQCRKRFDFILIDAPPVLAVADPVIIAPVVDAVLMALKIRKNGRRSVERAVQILKEVDVKPVGLVVNSTDRKSNKNYGYSDRYNTDRYSYVGKYNDYYAAHPGDDDKKSRSLVVSGTPDASSR